MKQFRDKMIAEFSGIENSYLNGHPVKRLPNNINFSFENVDSEGLMIELRDVAVSSSSACSSSSMQSSSVLKAIGRNNKVATLRFGLGRHTTTEEVDYAIKRTIETIVKLRERSTLKEYCQNGKDLKTV
jgi:cysteine desulfurase